MNALQGSMSGPGHHQHVQQGLASGAGANAVAGNAGAGVGGASLMPAALQHQHSASTQPYSSIVCQDDGAGGQQQHHHHVLLHHHSPIPGVSPPAAARAAAAATAAGGAGGSSSSNGNTNPPSRYESQKRRDWNTFGQYLKNHRPPLALSRCSGAHVLEFLRYLDQFGKTKVHAPGCPFFGHPHPPAPCACPLRQAWGSLDALIGRLRAAFEEHGGKPESNPFGARAVRLYLREVREMQAKARGIAYEKKKRKRPPQPQQPFLQQQQQQQHQQPHHMQQQQHFEQGGPLGPLTPSSSSSSASRHAAASNSADHHLLLLHQQQHPHLLHQHQQQTLQHHHVQPQEQPVNNITGPSSLLLPRCN